MRKVTIMICIAVVWAVGGGILSAQTVYDLQDDWVWNTNPNGPWSYGHSADMTDPLEYAVNLNNDSWDPVTCDVWWAREYYEWPLIWKADGFNDAHSFDGEVLMQGWGNGGEASVIRFVAPVEGYFDINITFFLRYSSVQNIILFNDSVVLDITNGNYYYNGLGQLVYEYSLSNFWLSAGDTIDMGVRDISSGNCKIALVATISEYSEPVILCEDLGTHHVADLNQDCYFDMADMLILIENWLQCNDPELVNCSVP